MKKIFSLLMLAVVIFCSCNKDDEPTNKPSEGEYVLVCFNGILKTAESEYVGPAEGDLPDGIYYYESTFTDPSGEATFTHYVPSSGKYFGGGFTYTNKTDLTTASYLNSSAITGKGAMGDSYLICNVDGTSRFAEITFKDTVTVLDTYITNSTYAYLSMKNGDDFNEKFTEDDWFKLTITGWLDNAKSGEVIFDLAKGTKIVDQWKEVPLSSLGEINKLTFTMDSSDKTSYDGGLTYSLNTPTYFCMDALRFKK